MENSQQAQFPAQAHIAVLPTPGMGHLFPLAELAKRLVHHHGLSVTFITFAESASKAQQSLLSSLPSSITSVSLPPVDLSDLPSTAKIETRMSAAAARSVPALTAILRQLSKSNNLVAFVADLFGADTFDAARELGVPAWMFFPSNYLALSFMLHLPHLDKAFPYEFRDLPLPVKLPGCVPIPGADVLAPLQDKKDEAYAWMVHHGSKYREAAGILTNTFDEIEPEAARVLKSVEPDRPPVYSVGPLIRTGFKEAEDGSGCVSWLDKQPVGSVLFVSFGSGGTLSTEQTGELALGLEMSGQRFLWVVRSPSDHDPSGNYFNSESARDPFEFLPEGFLERTKGAGFVVSSWAPQIEVLSHGATGGFLTHCGWNSTLESIVHGVPMIAWPLFAEQKQNAVMLVEDAKVALRPKFGEDGMARREEISKVVNGDVHKATQLLQKIRGTDDVQAELDDIVSACSVDSQATTHPFRKLLQQREYRPHLAMAIALPFFQQVTGINVVNFYAPVMFRTIGFKERASLLSAVVTRLVATCFNIVAMFVVDRSGRRSLLLIGGFQMLVSLLLVGGILSAELEDHGAMREEYGYIVLAVICVYVAGFAWSWGPLAWLIAVEIFPLEIRSAGQSIVVAVGFFVTFVVAQSFLLMLCQVKSAIFFFFGVGVLVMTLFVYVFLPETKGLPLEQMSRVWREHWYWRKIVRAEGDERKLIQEKFQTSSTLLARVCS